MNVRFVWLPYELAKLAIYLAKAAYTHFPRRSWLAWSALLAVALFFLLRLAV